MRVCLSMRLWYTLKHTIITCRRIHTQLLLPLDLTPSQIWPRSPHRPWCLVGPSQCPALMTNPLAAWKSANGPGRSIFSAAATGCSCKWNYGSQMLQSKCFPHFHSLWKLVSYSILVCYFRLVRNLKEIIVKFSLKSVNTQRPRNFHWCFVKVLR